jgi:hypothetical protein
MITLRYRPESKDYEMKAYFDGHPELTRIVIHSEEKIKTSNLLSKFAEYVKKSPNEELTILLNG